MNFSINATVLTSNNVESEIFSTTYFTPETLSIFEQFETLEKENIIKWFNRQLDAGDAYRLIVRIGVALNIDTNSTNQMLQVARDTYLGIIPKV